MSLTSIVILGIVLVALHFCGISISGRFSAGGGGGVPAGGGQVSEGQSQSADEMKEFVAVVLAETEDVWNGVFQAEGQAISGADAERCSAGRSSRPAATPRRLRDRSIARAIARSISTPTFFDQLDSQFGASGDFAQAYVIAHEVGHHVQNLIGVLPKFNEMRQDMSEADANAMSMRVELQADCFAGVWAHFTAQKGLLEQGDVEEALNAAQQIGDDTLQKRTQGYVVPESFNHGTSAAAPEVVRRGMKSGKLSDCDTFNNPI